MVRYALEGFLTLTLLAGALQGSLAQLISPIPSGIAQATPGSHGTDVTAETLAEIRLPAEAIPPSPAIFDVWLATLAPGEELGFETGASPPSIVADVVLSGEFAILSEGRLQVQRAAGREDVPPNTVVTVRPGEAVIYVDNQAAQTFRNTGRGTLMAISFGIFSSAPPSTFTEGAISQADWERSGLAGHDLTVRVERLTVPPLGSLPAFVPEVQAPRIFVVAEGVAHSATIAPGAMTPSATVPVARGETLRFQSLRSGEQLQLRNEDDRPLVLLQVTISADDMATPTPATAPHRLPKWPVSAPGAVRDE